MMRAITAGAAVALPLLLPWTAEGMDLSEELLDMGSQDVGFIEDVVIGSGREVELLVWYPALVGPEDAVAAYPIRVPATTTTLSKLPDPYTFDGDDLVAAIEGDVPAEPAPHEPLATAVAYAGADVAPGPHPVMIHLPGGGAPGILHTYEGLKYATHGIVFISVTVPLGTHCDRAHDADTVLATLHEWNTDPTHPLYQALDEDALFGGGWSLGGRTWIARTSAEPECEMPQETRLSGLYMEDATREALTVAQIERNVTPTFLSSQYCRPLQIDLHELLGSKPRMMMLEGYTTLPSNANHTLFAQACMLGRSLTVPFGPPQVQAWCQDPVFRARERFFAANNSRYGIAFVWRMAGEGQYSSVFAPDQITDPGVTVIQPRSNGDGHSAELFCFGP